MPTYCDKKERLVRMELDALNQSSRLLEWHLGLLFGDLMNYNRLRATIFQNKCKIIAFGMPRALLNHLRDTARWKYEKLQNDFIR